MSSLIGKLTKAKQQELLDDLNYLNMSETKSFCNKHSIPYSIWIETENGVRKTADDDRKGVILNRIRHYLRTGKILPTTCFPLSVICFNKPRATIKATDRLCYGQYDKTNEAMIGLLKKLTGGRFKNGAIARIVAREFWMKGIAPTYEEYAAAWLKANEDHKRPNPEWAFLSDRAEGKDMDNWKQLRAKKARQVLKILTPKIQRFSSASDMPWLLRKLRSSARIGSTDDSDVE